MDLGRMEGRLAAFSVSIADKTLKFLFITNLAVGIPILFYYPPGESQKLIFLIIPLSILLALAVELMNVRVKEEVN